MTLCIGALCQPLETLVVVAYDTMGTSNIAEAENIHKLERIGKYWWALLAGEDVSTARELIALFRGHLGKRPGDDREALEERLDDDALEALRKPIERPWDNRRGHLARLLTGRDYEKFLKEQAKFPERIHNAIFYVEVPRIECSWLAAF